MLVGSPTYRLLTANDAENYLKFLCQLDSESPYMHYRAGERQMTVQGMRSRIRKQEKQGNSFVVLALGIDDLPIGYFSVNGGNSEATAHSATVAVGVLKAYQRQGIAAKLFEHAKWRALAVGVFRFECTVVCRNPATAFYNAMHFERVGCLRDRFWWVDRATLEPEYIYEKVLSLF